MHITRSSVRASAALGVALLAALLVASSPSASGRPTQARPLLAGELARGQPLTDVENLVLPSRGGAKARSLGAGLGSGGSARIVLETSRPEEARRSIRAAGGRVEGTSKGLVQAVVPRRALDALARTAGVDRVRAPFRLVEHAIGGEEVASTLAQAWHGAGLTGKNVDVAIIDGGFAGLAERQAQGDLPANVVTVDFCRGGLTTASEHGTGVAEIVHEMAPAARLHLVCIDTEVDLANAVGYVKSKRIGIVNHSMGWFGPSRGDGTGYISALVADARANGVLWVNSAGNEAETHWSGTFQPGGDIVHDWAPSGDEGNSFVLPAGSMICGTLKWDEWPNAVSDFDLALVDAETNELIDIADAYQTGSQPPLEDVCVDEADGVDHIVYWAIVGYAVSSNPRLDLWSYSPPLQYAVASGSIVDPATSPAALAVGALCWQTRQLEPYSSQGPTIDGRLKPDLVGHDSVSSATYGPFVGCPSGFAGTSASSPEVAGAAALVLQAYPSWTPAEVQAYLTKAARDLGSRAADNQYGAGELRMPQPPDLVAPRATALASAGRYGRAVGLYSRIADDSGQVRLEVRVQRNGRVVASLKRGFVSASESVRVGLTWRAPAASGGTYRQCVRAFDRAGNASTQSCARISLR